MSWHFHKWHYEGQNERNLKWASFFLFPFLSFLYSLKSLNTKTSYIIVFLFTLLYGLCFTVGTDRDIWTIDAAWMRVNFEEMCQTTPHTFYQSVKEYFTFESAYNKDIFAPFLMFLVSRVTTNYHFLFILYAALFGFVTLKCLRYLTLDDSYKNTLVCFLLVLFFTINQIFNINGFRFYFTAWVAVLCVFKILLEGNWRYWILLCIITLFHISYFFFLPIFTLCYFTKSLKKIWFSLFLISIFLSSFVVNILNFESALPPVFSSMIDTYLSDDAIQKTESTQKAAAWYTTIFQMMSQIYPNIILLIIYFKREIIKERKDYQLFLFCLSYMTIVNLISVLPSLGRFAVLDYPILAYLWLRCFKGEKYNGWIYIMPLFMFLPFFHLTLNYFKYTSGELLYSNPVFMLLGLL